MTLGLEHGTVRLVAHDPAWAALFRAEAARVRSALGPDRPLALEHMGSTAVPGLVAKPVLDVLAGRPAAGDHAPYVTVFEASGYRYRGEFGIPGRHYFVRDDAAGRRTHQVHLVEYDGAFWCAHLAFRDALRRSPERAAAYAALKLALALAARHPDDRAAYTDGKTAFIAEALASAAHA